MEPANRWKPPENKDNLAVWGVTEARERPG